MGFEHAAEHHVESLTLFLDHSAVRNWLPEPDCWEILYQYRTADRWNTRRYATFTLCSRRPRQPRLPETSRAPWDFWSLFSLFSRFVKFYHGLPRYPWRVVGVRAAESRRLKGALRFGLRSTTDASTFPPGPSRSDRIHHVSYILIKVWHVFHVLPRLSTYETWTPGSFGARLCPRYEERASQAGFCWRKSMMSSFSSSKKLVTTLGLPFS